MSDFGPFSFGEFQNQRAEKRDVRETGFQIVGFVRVWPLARFAFDNSLEQA